MRNEAAKSQDFREGIKVSSGEIKRASIKGKVKKSSPSCRRWSRDAKSREMDRAAGVRH